MHETTDDLAELQALLDRSAAAAGPHLSRVITPERRLGATEVCALLDGVALLALATVTADARPLVSPVNGIFYRGAFHFGSAPDSVRSRHLSRRPQVSATHLRGEELAVTVHGRALPVALDEPGGAGFRAALLGLYVPRYGSSWEDEVLGTAVYWRVEADRMFTFHLAADDA